ncbi:class I SAM-dependent methyltransferase [Mycolicibacterium baixiangningiae]|uniref:class I SAM-dependent methyltransferase n=1 Tax=Mycolicibacterium baixiangningiae TaxID=2761578 RepID=UPI001868C474|nr:methyltransferase domain-containing protein [Mycolicibacterium baixiangningiae]
MTGDYLEQTRAGYDATAAEYAERFHHWLDRKPVELAVLQAFAGLVGTGGHVADVGCGTGATTAILAGHGCRVTGIDLSPNMIGEARRLNLDLDFRIGSMTALDFADESVDGVCAWYSVIHIPDEDLDAVVAEFARVLRPGGHVLLAFQVGERPLVLDEAFGRKVSLVYHRRPLRQLGRIAERHGFTSYVETVRGPDDDGLESTPHAFLIVRKPTAC